MRRFYRSLAAATSMVALSVMTFGQTAVIKTQRTAPRGLVSYSQAVTLTGIGNTRHVDGYVKQYASGNFVYPVGHKGVYRPFAADADGTVGAYFQDNPAAATLPSGAPFNTNNKGTGVSKVSTKEYWDIDGTKASQITVTWNASSGIADLTSNTLSSLKILGWNAGTAKWDIIPSTVNPTSILGGASTLTTGSISTNNTIVPNTYNVYTLGSLAVATPIYYGNLELASCTEIKGWVMDKSNTSSALTIELYEGSTVYATEIANIFRSDVKNAGYGTGNYGFRFATPEALKNGQTRQLRVRVKDTSYNLLGTPKSITCAGTPPPAPSEYKGNFETASCTNLKGWVWDKTYPDRAMTVEVVEGTTVHLTIVANTLRQDLLNAGYGTGKYGFNVPLPASLANGQPRQLVIRVKDTTFKLYGSPKTVTCTGSARIGLEETESQIVSTEELVVAPNPTSGMFTATYHIESGKKGMLRLTNITGRTVWQKAVDGTGETVKEDFDLAGQAAGVYLLQVQTDNKNEVKRIMLTK